VLGSKTVTVPKQIHQIWLSPATFVELNTQGGCISVGDNRSSPTRFDFDGIILELGVTITVSLRGQRNVHSLGVA
jgi:hypothetical protein